MALGYCRACEKLVPIKPGPYKLGSRERYWYPHPHDTPEGKPCEVKRGI